jgi:hypothetical protein
MAKRRGDCDARSKAIKTCIFPQGAVLWREYASFFKIKPHFLWHIFLLPVYGSSLQQVVWQRFINIEEKETTGVASSFLFN